MAKLRSSPPKAMLIIGLVMLVVGAVVAVGAALSGVNAISDIADEFESVDRVPFGSTESVAAAGGSMAIVTSTETASCSVVDEGERAVGLETIEGTEVSSNSDQFFVRFRFDGDEGVTYNVTCLDAVVGEFAVVDAEHLVLGVAGIIGRFAAALAAAVLALVGFILALVGFFARRKWKKNNSRVGAGGSGSFSGSASAPGSVPPPPGQPSSVPPPPGQPSSVPPPPGQPGSVPPPPGQPGSVPPPPPPPGQPPAMPPGVGR